jgi:hypothetical protein
MILKGADLMAWAERKAHEYEHDSGTAAWARPTLPTLIAESYLRGAIDALEEEKQEILGAAKVGRLEAEPVTGR